MKSSNDTDTYKDQVTMADIAARAGVAVSTVSRVINRSPLVAPAKRKEIEVVIAEMGYRPAPLEKRKGIRKDPWPWIRHHAFKLILFGQYDLHWITNHAPIYSYALHGVEEATSPLGFRRDLERVETESELLKVLEKGDADGFLVLNTGHDPLPDKLSQFPVVTFMGSHDHLLCDRVLPDAERAGYLAAKYLRGKGCRYCIAIGGDTSIYRKRAEAFSEALKAYNIDVVEVLDASIERGGPRLHQANRSLISAHVKPLLAKAAKPVGIFSVADVITPAIYSEMKDVGFTIGSNLHVVSCNNERPYLDPLDSAPAVIDTQADYIGQRAVRQLLRRLESPDSPYEKILIQPKLIEPNGD